MIDKEQICLDVINETFPTIQITKVNLNQKRSQLLDTLENESNVAILLALCQYFPLDKQPIKNYNVFLTVSGTRFDLTQKINEDILSEHDKKNYRMIVAGKFELQFFYCMFSMILVGAPTTWGASNLIVNLILLLGSPIPEPVILAATLLGIVISAIITCLIGYKAVEIRNKIGSNYWQICAYPPDSQALLLAIETAIDKVSPKNCFQTCYARLFKVSNEPNKPPYVEPSLPSLP